MTRNAGSSTQENHFGQLLRVMAEKIVIFCRYYVPIIVLLPYRTLQFFYQIKTQVPIEPKHSSSFITDSEIQSEFAHHAPGVAMMNNGSFGCCPASVISALHQWQLKMLRQPSHFLLNELKNRILESRTIIKDLINAEDVDEVSIVDNISTAAAIVLQQTAWALLKGNSTKGMLSLCLAALMVP
ncbi:putative L-cysteine desulfhydrase chloroplastic [Prunus yedoensis var. nudiflora]|uniref:Putative L-cysteine desulfhydrase chloroplastic n=1 Tax=Prunus yedoensis var. nudiflora TaxID=2094558 RepID=A0A314UKG4_PRUYE|nr:putative L-cysteine desulfhydrase chloroplastic [Prunus yedoensis var. nudiflora]